MSNVNVVNIKRSNKVTPKKAEPMSEAFDHDSVSPMSDLELLYDSTFFEIVMNARGRYDEAEYDTILSIICPSLSSNYSKMHQAKAQELIKQYCNIKPQEASFVSNMPELASATNHVFLYFFKEFFASVKTKGIQETLDENQEFFFTNEVVFKTLPASFVFALINFVEKK